MSEMKDKENTDICLWFDGNEEMAIELKDCPFCGDRPYMHQIGNVGCKKYKIKTGCKRCRFNIINASLGQSEFKLLVKVSIEQWNKRVN